MTWSGGTAAVAALGLVGLFAVATAAGAARVRSGAAAPVRDTVNRFVSAWSTSDARAMYQLLDTSISEANFVEALRGSAAPVKDIRIGRVTLRSDQSAVVSYSARIPSAQQVAAALVFANRLRYPEACSDLNLRQSRARRMSDELHLERDRAGRWRIGLRGDSDFMHEGGRLLALSFDLAPAFVWGHITAAIDTRDPVYDDAVIVEGLTAYWRGLGLDVDENRERHEEGQSRAYVARVASECRGAQGDVN